MSEINVIVNDDKTKAYLQINLETEGAETELSVQDMMRVLNAKKVTHGILENIISECIRPENWGQTRLIAEGKPAVNGVDAKIIKKFTLNKEGTPLIDEHGNADYKNLGLIINVRAGEELAERIPPRDGETGITVSGTELGYVKGRDVVLPKGKNTYANEEGTILYAAIDGQVRLYNNLIAVEPVFELSGDVDYSSGNINFLGNIVIHGNVISGFEVTAQGNIDIDGYVENAFITSDGDIRVKGGIKTGQKGLVKAGGNVSSKFIENSKVEAGGDIIVREAVVQSVLIAGGDVKVTDNKATIVGGLVQAGGTVEAKVIGSPLATNTAFEVGINPTLRTKYYSLNKELDKINDTIVSVDGNIKTMQNSGINIDQISPSRRQMLVDLLEKYRNLLSQKSDIEKQLESLQDLFSVERDTRVRALKVVYPGVSVNIGPAYFEVNDEILEAEFVLKQGEIHMQSI